MGIDQLNFDDFEDGESCESADNMFNLGGYEDQDDVSADQDFHSINDILLGDSVVYGMTNDVHEYRAAIGGSMFLSEHSRPDIL